MNKQNPDDTGDDGWRPRATPQAGTASEAKIDEMALADEIENCTVDLFWTTQAGSTDRKSLSSAKRDAIIAALRAQSPPPAPAGTGWQPSEAVQRYADSLQHDLRLGLTNGWMRETLKEVIAALTASPIPQGESPTDAEVEAAASQIFAGLGHNHSLSECRTVARAALTAAAKHRTPDSTGRVEELVRALDMSEVRWRDLATIIRRDGNYDNAGFCIATANRLRAAIDASNKTGGGT